MSTALGDTVTVELVDEQPAVFWWRQFPYVIEGQPMLFYRRRAPWWMGESTPSRVDDEFWRVSASRDGSEELAELYDLRHDADGWRLVFRW